MGLSQMLKLALACGAGLAAAGSLTSCSSAPEPVTTSHLRASASAPAPTESTPSPDAASNPSFLRHLNAAPWGVTLVPGETIVGNSTNYVYPVQIPEDSGAIEYARGTPVKEGAKVVAYRVASGDIYDYIAKRFHLTNDGYLLILNEQLRGEAAQLYAGDILNLSASTLDKYGTVNGRIAHGPQPVAAPPQEP